MQSPQQARQAWDCAARNSHSPRLQIKCDNRLLVLAAKRRAIWNLILRKFPGIDPVSAYCLKLLSTEPVAPLVLLTL